MSASNPGRAISPRDSGNWEEPAPIPAKSTLRLLLKWVALSLAGLVGLALLATAVLFTYIWWDARVSPDLEGRIVIYGLRAPEPGEPCRTGWALIYADIYAGASAQAHDAKSGHLVGYGSIDEGAWVDGACVFPFAIPNVDDAESYRISLGSLGLHSLTISREELKRRDWRVQLVLGKPPSGGGT
jgi:hypothetical protein